MTRLRTIKTLLLAVSAVFFLSSCTERNNLPSEQLNSFLDNTDPGFYGKSVIESFTHTDFISQYSVYRYNNGETADYRVLTTAPAQFVTVSGIPTALSTGDVVTVTITQNFTENLSDTLTGEFTVEQTNITHTWLYDHENDHGIIILTE